MVDARSAMSAISRARLCKNIPYAEDMVRELQKQGLVDMEALKGMMRATEFIAKTLPFLGDASFTILPARAASTDLALDTLKNRIGKFGVVELGVGLSPRGLAIDDGALYIETDLTNDIKIKRRVARAIKVRDNHLFVELDATDPTDFEKLEQVFLQHRQDGEKLVFVFEGLMMNLTWEQQAAIRDNMRRMLKNVCPDGACVSPDHSFGRAKLDVLTKANIRRERQQGKTTTVFTDQKAVEDFWREGGFRIEPVPNETIADLVVDAIDIDISKKKILKRLPNCEARIMTLA